VFLHFPVVHAALDFVDVAQQRGKQLVLVPTHVYDLAFALGHFHDLGQPYTGMLIQA